MSEFTAIPVVTADSLALEFDHFSFAYPDCSPVLTDVTQRVAKGAFALLVGATGSGKTTLLRCCKPEIAPAGTRGGNISVLGRPVDKISCARSAASIGYVAQNPDNQMVCDTVWHELAFGLENLGISQDMMHRRVAEVVHFFGIEHLMHVPVAELSGGQKQLVNLAAVLAMQPQILLLDEPTAQLDPVAEKSFLHALFRVNRELNITVVVATHAPELMVQYATSAFELSEGQLASVPLERYQVNLYEVDEQNSTKFSCVQQHDPTVFVHDAYVRYAHDDDWVLRGCDVDVYSGSIYAVVGSNGCGKSTLLRTIAGTLKSERGRVRNTLQKKQVFLPQDPQALFACDTVEEELLEWQKRCGYTHEEVEAQVARFKLQEVLAQHPFDLSGGQRQALALAKLLLTKPELLLLDEPVKGLDASAKCEVARALLDVTNSGVTVVLATHDLAFVSQIATTVTMLFDGEATCTEPADRFFLGNLFYRPVRDSFIEHWQSESHSITKQDESC